MIDTAGAEALAEVLETAKKGPHEQATEEQLLDERAAEAYEDRDDDESRAKGVAR